MTEKETTALSTDVRGKMYNALERINSELKKITDITGSTYKTNGEFRFNPTYVTAAPINIHKLKELRLLIGVLAAIIGHNRNYEEAAKISGLSTYPAFEWCGYTYEAWEHDLKIRISIVTQHEKTEQLQSAKKELEQFMTEEDRLEGSLNRISQLLG